MRNDIITQNAGEKNMSNTNDNKNTKDKKDKKEQKKGVKDENLNAQNTDKNKDGDIIKQNGDNVNKKYYVEYRPVQDRYKEYEQKDLYKGQIIEINYTYAVMTSSKQSHELIPVSISNFILEPVKTIVDDDGTKSVFNIVTALKTYKNIIIANKKLISNDFLKEIKEVNKGLNIETKYLQSVLEFINDVNEKTVKGTHKTGFIDGYFVTTKETYDNNLNPVKDVISYTNQNEYITTNIMKHKQLNKERFQELLNHLFKFNDLDKTVTILSYCVACYMKNHLIEYDSSYKLPQLYLIGEAGSGKTTTLTTIIQQIFSTDKMVSAGAGTTKFTLTKNASSSNFIPMMLDEYKPSKWNMQQINVYSDFLRSAYDNHIVERGQSNQSVTRYTLTAPLIVVGENQTDEQALNERGVVLEYFKKSFSDEHFESLKFLKKNKDLLNDLGFTLLKYFLQNKELDFKKIAEYELLLDLAVTRNNTSYAILLYAFDLFLQIINMYDLHINYTINDVIKLFQNQYKTATDSKSELIQTLELIDLMANMGVLEKDVDYKIDSSNVVLSLCTPLIYAKISKFVREYNINKNYLSQNAFTKGLKLEEYFIDYKKVSLKVANSERKKQVQCYNIELFKLKSLTDAFNQFDCEQ